MFLITFLGNFLKISPVIRSEPGAFFEPIIIFYFLFNFLEVGYVSFLKLRLDVCNMMWLKETFYIGVGGEIFFFASNNTTNTCFDGWNIHC